MAAAANEDKLDIEQRGYVPAQEPPALDCDAARRTVGGVRADAETGGSQGHVALLRPDRPGAGLSAIIEIRLDRQGAEHRHALEQRAAWALISS